jgi:hypothetical protein
MATHHLPKSTRLLSPIHSTFLFPELKIKLKGRHFDMTEAEWQAVTNILMGQDFQDAFRKWQKHWEQFIRTEGGYFEDGGGQWAQS